MKKLDKMQITDLNALFNQIMIPISINSISNTNLDLEEEFERMFPGKTLYQDNQETGQFLIKYNKYIDMYKYATMQLKAYSDVINNWDQYKGRINASYEDSRKIVGQLVDLIKDKNVTIYFLDYQEDNTLEVKQISSQEYIDSFYGRKTEVKQTHPRLEELTKNETIFKIANTIVLSDLADVCIEPKKLGELLRQEIIYNSLMDVGLLDEEKVASYTPGQVLQLTKENERTYAYKAALVNRTVEAMTKFSNNIDYDQLLLCSAYRCKEYLNEELKTEQKSSEQLREMVGVYNNMFDFSKEIGDSKIKMKAKLEGARTGESSYVKYSSKNLSYDMEAFRRRMLPNTFRIEQDILQSLEQREVKKPSTFERVKTGENILPQQTIEQLDKKDRMTQYKKFFVSPEEKMEVFQSSDPLPTAYRGKIDGAYKGYAAFLYEKLGIAIVECFWKEDKDGNMKYPYGDATVITPIENIDMILQESVKKLDNIPIAREYKSPRIKDETYVGNATAMRSVEEKSVRRPVRKYHGENWKSYMEEVVQGRIDPFKPTIRIRKQKQIMQTEERKEEIEKSPEEIK